MNSVLEPGVICTASGRKLNVQSPDHASFDIEDIAYALSNTARYGGHAAPPITVAEHSLVVYHKVWMSTEGNPKVSLAALLHDAEEAYLGDMPTPIKILFPTFVQCGDALRAEIYAWANLPRLWAFDPPVQIQAADVATFVIERHHYMPKADWWPDTHGDCELSHWGCLAPATAAAAFVRIYHHLQELRHV